MEKAQRVRVLFLKGHQNMEREGCIRNALPIFFDENRFLVEQIKKGAITEKEKRWRGRYFLTPEALIGGDGEHIRRERE